MRYLIILLLLTSCSTTSLMKRYVKRGGTFEQVDKIVTVRDTIQGVNGNDSIVFRDLIVPCPDPVIETRWKTRIKYKFDSKRFRDSLKHYRILDKVKQKYALKNNRVKSRVEKNKDKQITKQVKAKYGIWKILIGLVAGFGLAVAMRKMWK